MKVAYYIKKYHDLLLTNIPKNIHAKDEMRTDGNFTVCGQKIANYYTWSESDDTHFNITCPKCLKKMSKTVQVVQDKDCIISDGINNLSAHDIDSFGKIYSKIISTTHQELFTEDEAKRLLYDNPKLISDDGMDIYRVSKTII
jgi:hypothetical protein